MGFNNKWTGYGCDVCGFGTVEDVEEYDPRKPCPECGDVALSAEAPRHQAERESET